MTAHRRAIPITVLLLSIAAPLLAPAAAQSIWLPATAGTSLSLEALKPIPARDPGMWTGATSAYFLSGVFPVTGALAVTGEVPFAYAGVRLSRLGGEGTQTSSTLGNPSVGLRYSAGQATAELGVRIPLHSSDDSGDFAELVGTAADYDRLDAFLEDVATVRATLGIQQRTAEGLVARVRGGLIHWAYVGDGPSENDTGLSYAAQVGYEVERFSLIGGVTGLGVLTAEGSYPQRSFHHLGAAAAIAVAGVQPGIVLRVPIDEALEEELKYVIGLQLTVPIR